MTKTFISLFVAATLIIFSCKPADKKQSIIASQDRSIDLTPGSCPYLTKDNRNNLVLSWIRHVDSTTNIICYATSTDEGKTFSGAIEIPGSSNVHPHGENMPKIVFKPSGEIIAAWGAANPNPANPYSGLVYYTQSFDEGKTWTKPKSLTTDTASFDQRYFDMALLPNGEAGITWLDNRKRWNNEGSGLFYAVSKGKEGFKNERLISGPCCQCCRTDLYIDKNENIHVLYRGIINDSIRDMVHIVSSNSGNTFTEPQRISADNWVINGCPHTGPAMTENKDGVHYTWFTGGNNAGIYYNNSKGNGNHFTPRDSVSGQNSKHCQITSLANNNIVIVWNESFPNGNTFSSRIGIEERDAEGKVVKKDFVTSDNSNSSFPVIFPVGSGKCIIAYTENIGKLSKVMYKQVLFN